jgi:XRE family transcriptional regulator, aerobic/anaerobic benzoate catabolism transcriptional regulator
MLVMKFIQEVYLPRMDPFLAALGARIRVLRAHSGMSVGDLAGRAGLSTRFVTDLQAGRANVSIVRLRRLAHALGTSVSSLVAEAEAGQADAPAVVALLGVRGAGKSTIGAQLAARLHVEFFELDRLVEAEAGIALAEIFATHGEDYFRRLEVSALRRLLARNVAGVVATGGGIVENAEAWKLLEEQTMTVWLRASAEDHWRRVVRQGDPRPMAGRPAAKAELRRLLVRRAALYERARYRVDTARLGIGGSVRSIAAKLANAT